MTDKEKYNNLSSIDIYSLSNEELKKAIHEWAEGEPVIEELLWKCYNSGVETRGCHAGGRPYLTISADKSTDKVKNMLASVCDVDGFSIIISPDGGNAFSGDNFYKSDLGIVFLKTMYKDEADEIFKKMITSLDEIEIKHNKMVNSIIDLYTFFKEKESDLSFRIILDENIFEFSIEMSSAINYDYYCNIFKNIGLTMEPNNPGIWYFSSNNVDDFESKLEYVKNILIKEYNLELPTKIENGMSFNQMFRLLRRKYIEKYGDDLKFKEFKNEFEKEFNQKEDERFNKIITGEELWQWLEERLQSKELELSSTKTRG